jgi:hypothetical protein
MSATRIRITSLETPEDFFVFEAKTLALAVAKCVTELQDVWTFEYEEELATLLKTISEAIESAEKTAQEWDFSSPGDAYKVEIEEFTQLTDEMICDLCIATTRDSTGAHFTQWLSSHSELEDLGLVKIGRPRHPGTGIPFGSDHWTLEITEAGQAVVDSHPELHPGDTDHTGDNDHDSRKAGVESIATVPTAKKIKAVTQRIMHGDCSVNATFEDGKTVYLFSYYIDELSFEDSEFIGLTQKEAMALRHKKDVAYLQS